MRTITMIIHGLRNTLANYLERLATKLSAPLSLDGCPGWEVRVELRDYGHQFGVAAIGLVNGELHRNGVLLQNDGKMTTRDAVKAATPALRYWVQNLEG